MSTTTERATERSHRLDAGSATEPTPREGSTRRLVRRGALLVFIVGMLTVAAYGSSRYLGSLGAPSGPTMSTYRVEPTELTVTVTEDGNVESASNVDIKCQVAGGSSILWIVDDGQEVKKGEKLVDLDSSTIEDQINTQRIAYSKAKSAVIQAQKDFRVAQISVEEYLEGTFKQESQDAEALVTISKENHRAAQNGLEYSERMFQRGYISSLELETQQFAVQRAKLELDSAVTARDVLIKYTKTKTVEDLKSTVETARAAQESEQAAFELEEGKLKRLETQLKNCVIHAPQDGMVVYANERSRWGQQSATIEEGAAVRDRQTILQLPELSKMLVKVKVHETKVEDIQPNMRARINLQGRELQGVVRSVANQHEATSWFSGNVKEYATKVAIDGEVRGLKPGMTAEVEILVARLTDVLTLPVSAVVEQRGTFYCWVRTPDGSVERRPLVLGLSNEQFVEVTDGIVTGDEVVRNPRAFIDEARVESPDETAADRRKDFGESSEEPAADEPKKKQSVETSAASQPEDARPESKDARPPVRGMADPPSASPGSNDRPPSKAPAPDRSAGASPGRRGAGGAANLMRYDTDGDGLISKDEAPQWMQSFFDRMDPNGDGMIDKDEIAKIRERMQSRTRPSNEGGTP